MEIAFRFLMFSVISMAMRSYICCVESAIRQNSRKIMSKYKNFFGIMMNRVISLYPVRTHVSKMSVEKKLEG